MRLFLVFTVLALAYGEDKLTDKRAATDIQYATSPKPNYSTATIAGLSSAATPSYQTKAQYLTRPAYVHQQPVAYEQQVAQPVVKYAYAAQPSQAYKVAAAPSAVAYAQPQYNYQAYEQPQYAYVQPDVKYTTFSQPAKAAAAPPKIQYTAPAAVTYQAAVAPSAHSAPSAPQIHYSPADTVSSFQFSNPHVSYSNLGLLSQVVGKAASPQVQYSSAPHYVSSGSQQVQYSSPQVQYSHAPQVQYVPQHYSSSPQVQYVQQASHSSPNYIYTSPSKSYNSPIPYSH